MYPSELGLALMVSVSMLSVTTFKKQTSPLRAFRSCG